MLNYELVFIVNPDISDGDVPKAIDKVTELINKLDGSVTETNQWGRKKLAFPIRKYNEGNYVLSKVALKQNTLKELESTLLMSEDILRHLLIRVKA
jgi:small subunit ribosomal protein S6